MALITAQKINDWYDSYRGVETVFAKEIVQATGLVSNQMMLKCGSDFFPCVLYSTSFEEAKVIANLKSGLLGRLEEANNICSLKYYFKPPQSHEEIVFFVTSSSKGYKPFNNMDSQGLFTIQYKNRPSDDLISILGRIIEANNNCQKQKDQKITIDPDTMRKIHLVSKEIAIAVDRLPRKCILRDLSFSGARVIIAGLQKFLVNKQVEIRLEFEDPKDIIMLAGSFVGSVPVAGRDDFAVMHVTFATVPVFYKLRVNDFLTSITRVDQAKAAAKAEQKNAAIQAATTASVAPAK
jgi:hypothetical protein